MRRFEKEFNWFAAFPLVLLYYGLPFLVLIDMADGVLRIWGIGTAVKQNDAELWALLVLWVLSGILVELKAAGWKRD